MSAFTSENGKKKKKVKVNKQKGWTKACVEAPTLANTSNGTKHGVQKVLIGIQCSSSLLPLDISSKRNCTN